MKVNKWILISSFVLLVMLAFGGVFLTNAASGQQAPQVDPVLQAVLEAQGQANIFVEFRAEADLSSAEKMDW
ncbi:MAG: hypothetical protein EHM38_02400, partial [Geobacteraceae bacterium]